MQSRPGRDDTGRGLVAFLPGTWVRPSSWMLWQLVFDRNGYDSVIVDQPHHNVKRSPQVSLRSLLAQCADALSRLPDQPILIGHGTGAVLAQVLLDRPRIAVAAIALSPPPAGWASKIALPGFGRAAIAVKSVSRPPDYRISATAFGQTYANTRPAAEVDDLYQRYVIPGSCRPLIQTAFAFRPPGRSKVPTDRPPLLLVSGGKDRLTPEWTARSWERYGRRRHPDSVTDHHVFPDRGHSLAVDAGAEEVANYCLDWLSSQNL